MLQNICRRSNCGRCAVLHQAMLSSVHASNNRKRRHHEWLSSADWHQHNTGKGIKGKVKPPRLHGISVGVFALRTPHRPNAIGLSLCKIHSVAGRELTVLGADIVDGTPVLDVKPYLPFCEALNHASAPAWVQVPHLRFCSRMHKLTRSMASHRGKASGGDVLFCSCDARS